MTAWSELDYEVAGYGNAEEYEADLYGDQDYFLAEMADASFFSKEDDYDFFCEYEEYPYQKEDYFE